ncbi:MAG: lipopolysaccharide biosynthesis protein [Prevotella sp.]|nr:lipopolysaccharide biosynthesis protein [Prevotella sp.]
MGESLKERTAKGLLWGAVNNVTSQLLGVAIGIVLGRLLSPAEYGMVGMLAIFTAIAGSLQESGFTAALTNMKQATHRDYNAVFWFSTLMSVALYGVLYLSAPLIADYFRQPGLVPLSRLVFASLLMAGLGTAHAAYMFRNMMNREKALIGFAALTGSGIVGIALALGGYSYWSLAWQQFAYITIVNLGRLLYVRWHPSLHVDLSPIRRMFGFSSKILLTNIMNQANSNLLSFVFGRLFTAGAVGSYTQAAKWNLMGHSLITGTIQQVAQPVLASINDEENRQLKVFRKMLRFTAMLSMPALFGLGLIADFIVLLLGDHWADSVMLLRILCVSGAFMPIHTLYQNLFISHGRSDTYMWCTAAQIAAQLVVIVAFSTRGGLGLMVTAYTVLMVSWTAVWQLLAHRLTGLRLRDVLKDILPFMLAAIGCTAAAYVGTADISQPVLSIALRIVITAVLYILVMKISGAKIFDECIQFLFHRKTT